MATLLLSQRNFDLHVTPPGHPERAERIRAVEAALAAPAFSGLVRRYAGFADLGLAELVHGPSYLDFLRRARPAEGMGRIDEDTFISSGSLDAASVALGAAGAGMGRLPSGLGWAMVREEAMDMGRQNDKGATHNGSRVGPAL